MNEQRRIFLKGLLAVVAAPAIVKADNLMKIWVPPEPRIVTSSVPQQIYVEYANEVWNNAAGKSWERTFADIPQALKVARAGDSIYVTVPPKMKDSDVVSFVSDLRKRL